MIRKLALFGDSVTAGLGISGFNNPISSGGQGSWSELVRESLANISGMGPLISSGVIPVWSFAAPSGALWPRTGTFTAVNTANAYDKQPDGRGATGSHATDIWTFTVPPLYRKPIGFQLYFVDMAGGGDMQYSLDGGSWINFGQTLLGDNKLMTFKVMTPFSNTIAVRHFNGTSDVLGCFHGVELIYQNVTDGLIVHNHAVNGSALHSMFTSTGGDRMAIIDSVKAGTGSPDLPHPNIGTVAMYVNDIARANVTDWAADLNLLYARASPLGPVAFMSPYEVTPGTYVLAQQVSYRAQTKTSATSLGAKGPLDFYDVWSSNGWVGNAAEVAAGLLDDTTHPSQYGNLDMHPRIYGFIRNQVLNVGNVPSVYTVNSDFDTSVVYKGFGKPSTLLVADSFNRPNSATSVGLTNGSGMLDSRLWTNNQGVNGIGSNATNMISAFTVGSISGALSTLDLGIADLDVWLTVLGSANATCLVVRFTDTSNYWYMAHDGTNTKFRKVVAGVVNTMGAIYSGAATGDVMRAILNGSTLQFYRNGVLQETFADSHNLSATKHGFLVTASGGSIDNFSASVLSPVTASYSAAIPVSV